MFWWEGGEQSDGGWSSEADWGGAGRSEGGWGTGTTPTTKKKKRNSEDRETIKNKAEGGMQ